jgi:hypothetical protein
MKTITVELFTLAELSEEAKTRAYNDYLNLGFGYSWQSEANETLKAFCKLFNVSLDRDGDYKSFYNGSEFKDLANLSGPRLLSYLWNNYGSDIFPAKVYHNKDFSKKRKSKLFIDPFNCHFTGYCMDCDIIEPLVNYMRCKDWSKHTTFEDLLSDCIHQFNKAVQSDYEYQQSMEYFVEMSENNEWFYTIDGKFK